MQIVIFIICFFDSVASCVHLCCRFCFSALTTFQIKVDVVDIVTDKASIGKAFKKEAKVIMDCLGKLTDDEKSQLEKSLNEYG